jgi:hypothetical protein
VNGVGIPCLFRPGGWTEECDLVWLVTQVYRLLTVDPATMASPGDALNPEAARFWADRRADGAFPLPLAPPLVAPGEPDRSTATRPALRLRPVARDER